MSHLNGKGYPWSFGGQEYPQMNTEPKNRGSDSFGDPFLGSMLICRGEIRMGLWGRSLHNHGIQPLIVG